MKKQANQKKDPIMLKMHFENWQENVLLYFMLWRKIFA